MKEKLALAVIVAALSGAAYAAGETDPAAAQDPAAATAGADVAASSSLMDLDTDKNGYISEEEAQANPDLVARWQELDANQDGQLDESEFAQFETEAETSTEAGAETPAPAQ